MSQVKRQAVQVIITDLILNEHYIIIYETEIKMVKSKWSYKKFMVEIRNRNELRGSGSKRITRVETDYEGRNELRGSK